MVLAVGIFMMPYIGVVGTRCSAYAGCGLTI